MMHKKKTRSMQPCDRFTNFAADPMTLARNLLGQRLVRMEDEMRLSGIIVEVEAYMGAEDRAAHTFGGRRTPRCEAMYLPGGHAYVYISHGIHHMLNIVCGRSDEGVAVLVRALEPEEGISMMQSRRAGKTQPTQLCSGPGKLCQALAIDLGHNGIDLRVNHDLWIERVRSRPLPAAQIRQTRRIGVESAGEWADRELRFIIAGNPHVSPGRG
ncbi:MAG: DNA-3-methyladenine glycosylase [Phycisphaerales bacterium]